MKREAKRGQNCTPNHKISTPIFKIGRGGVKSPKNNLQNKILSKIDNPYHRYWKFDQS